MFFQLSQNLRYLRIHPKRKYFIQLRLALIQNSGVHQSDFKIHLLSLRLPTSLTYTLKAQLGYLLNIWFVSKILWHFPWSKTKSNIPYTSPIYLKSNDPFLLWKYFHLGLLVVNLNSFRSDYLPNLLIDEVNLYWICQFQSHHLGCKSFQTIKAICKPLRLE